MTFNELIAGKVTVKELPEHCCACPFSRAEYDVYRCCITERYQRDYSGMKRMRGCPLRLAKEENDG